MAKKMRPELVALSTGLILGIYGAGYKLTQTTASASAPQVSVTPVHVPANGYRDGTYSGTGSNFLGNVSVAVSIKAGKITQVHITACNMHYPEYWIDGLPAEVITAQSTTIDVVSGATASSAAFIDAVTQALAQASTQSGAGGTQSAGSPSAVSTPQTGGQGTNGFGQAGGQDNGQGYYGGGGRHGRHHDSIGGGQGYGHGDGQLNGQDDGQGSI
jgi:uncharacterized protein with FMN-binding domain